MTMINEPCRYCGGDCPRTPDYMCDGYAGDIDNLYEEKNDD
tara:strand:+ start:206 stop:328 length:123 start_codon:yes stop_codon:yes gene_type:complete